MGKADLDTTKTRWKAITEIIAKRGTVSATEIVDYLKADYGIIVTRQTVTADLKKDLEALTNEDVDKIKSGILSQLDELIQIAYNRSKSGERDSLKAMDVYNKLIKTKADIVNSFEKMRMELVEKERPIYNIVIGKPLEIDVNDGKPISK
jgi:CRISPR/Cas system type I-B associated protein Csh2 (Cas7 group RAMP superfamily)